MGGLHVTLTIFPSLQYTIWALGGVFGGWQRFVFPQLRAAAAKAHRHLHRCRAGTGWLPSRPAGLRSQPARHAFRPNLRYSRPDRDARHRRAECARGLADRSGRGGPGGDRPARGIIDAGTEGAAAEQLRADPVPGTLPDVRDAVRTVEQIDDAQELARTPIARSLLWSRLMPGFEARSARLSGERGGEGDTHFQIGLDATIGACRVPSHRQGAPADRSE